MAAAVVEHPTTTWENMPDSQAFYRKLQTYALDGQLPNFADYIVAGCRNGGPIALMRDSSRLIAVGRASVVPLAKSQIQIYSPAGEPLLLLSWENAKIVKFGWTRDERLVVINEEGVYRLYDLQGEHDQHSLGGEAGEVGVIDARTHEGGFVALTGALTFFEVKGWEGGKPLALANPALAQPPFTWNLIPPDFSVSRHSEVLLSTDTTIHSLDALSVNDQRVSRGPFTHISPAPNGKSLALLTNTGVLWVVSSDFGRELAEFDTATAGAPAGEPVRQVEWCGNDAILVTWESLVLLVGPFGDTLRYYYEGATFAMTEQDGVRILSPGACDFVEKVPASSLSVFQPGSTTAAAILFDSYDHFTRRSSKADELIRAIKPDLAKAVDECVDAAGREWEPHWQRKLLEVAKFGRGFLNLYNPTDFVSMGQTLKVLNAVRFHEIGIPLTYSEYAYTSPAHLISRLTARNRHLLALRISSHLGLAPDPVLKHWARAKIARSRTGDGGSAVDDDVALCDLIVRQFENAGRGSVSYAEIARRAWEVGRGGLATRLLEHERAAGEQVPLLLSMHEDRLALLKAVDSGDTDLVYHVLLHLHKRLPLGSFFRLIEEGGTKLALASRLLEVYARAQNREMLRDFYYSDDRRVESAILCLDEASQMKDPAAKITTVKAAQKFLSEDKDRAFEAKMMDENVKLMNFQQQVEKKTDGKVSFFGLSVDETMHACIVNGLSKDADRIRTDFKVPDKRFWYVKLRALTSIRDFEGLESFSRTKRSPIGYTAFVRHLVEKGHPKEAASYVQRCDANRRVDLYVECGDWRAAGQECKTQNDKARIEQLRKSCPNSLIARELEQVALSMK